MPREGTRKCKKIETATYQLLPEYKIAELALPARKGRRELVVERTCTSTVCSTLPDLQLHEELACSAAAVLQDLLTVNLYTNISLYPSMALAQ